MILYAVSFGVLVLMILGVAARGNKRTHLALMSTAFILDLALVLYLETTRGAIGQVVAAKHGLLIAHGIISTGVLAAYIGQIALVNGWIIRHGSVRRTHILVGSSLLALRIVNFITSLMITTQS